MGLMYPEQFASWKPGRAVIPRGEYREDQEAIAKVLASALTINVFIRMMLRKAK